VISELGRGRTLTETSNRMASVPKRTAQEAREVEARDVLHDLATEP
jgi:hypothetical protein